MNSEAAFAPLGSQLTPALNALLQHRVVACLGAGGVGKTTVSAALALRGAQMGKRTLCLTIDPARRLAAAFGLTAFPKQEMEVSREFFAAHGVSLAAPLTVMMLDPRVTFDELVQRNSSAGGDSERILSHRVYEHLVKNLGGTQAYMAMEKVLSVVSDETYDLIVLDTPPAARALDFFDAPEKMARILDSPATRALVTALRGGGKLTPGVVGLGIRAALTGMERIAGASLLSEVADLVSAMNHLLGGFKQRALQVDAALRGELFGYALVTAAEPRTIDDAIDLSEALHERGVGVDAVVFNRMSPGGVPSSLVGTAAYDALAQLPQRLELSNMPEPLIERVVRVASHEQSRRHRQLDLCRRLLGGNALSRQSPSVACVPEFFDDVSRPDRLLRFGEQIRLGPDLRTAFAATAEIVSQTATGPTLVDPVAG